MQALETLHRRFVVILGLLCVLLGARTGSAAQAAGSRMTWQPTYESLVRYARERDIDIGEHPAVAKNFDVRSRSAARIVLFVRPGADMGALQRSPLSAAYDTTDQAVMRGNPFKATIPYCEEGKGGKKRFNPRRWQLVPADAEIGGDAGSAAFAKGCDAPGMKLRIALQGNQLLTLYAKTERPKADVPPAHASATPDSRDERIGVTVPSLPSQVAGLSGQCISASAFDVWTAVGDTKCESAISDMPSERKAGRFIKGWIVPVTEKSVQAKEGGGTMFRPDTPLADPAHPPDIPSPK